MIERAPHVFIIPAMFLLAASITLGCFMSPACVVAAGADDSGPYVQSPSRQAQPTLRS